MEKEKSVRKESPKNKDKKTRQKLSVIFGNNLFMVKFIAKASPGIIPISTIFTLLGAINSFMLNTYMYKYVLNAIDSGEEIKRILITVGIMFAYSLFYTVANIYRGFYMERKYPLVSGYIQNLLQKKALSLEVGCFENPEFYDSYVKAIGEAADRAFTVIENICNVIWVTFNIVATGVLIVTIHPIFLIPAIIPLIVTLAVGKRRNKIKYDRDMRNKEINRKKDYVRRVFYLADFSAEMRLTQIYKVMLHRMRDSVAELKDIVKQYGYKMMFYVYLFDFLFDIIVYTGTIIIAAYKTLVKKNMLLGDCFVVINSISNIAFSLNYVGDSFMRFEESSRYIANLRSFLDYEVKISENENAALPDGFKSLELHNVSFAYGEKNNPALKNLNLTINAGEKIAVVGSNGAGKTTLVKLLLRLYDTTSGEILLNGRSIKDYRLSAYRELYGTVFQDYRLFSASVAENVLLCGDIDEEGEKTVIDSLKNSGIYDKIMELPKGINTTVTREFDKEGAVFSGGEAQKIAIARVFAMSPEVVILDEPSSALDPIAESEMYNNMFAACKGKTVIFISHRLSSAVSADRVLLFDSGELTETGTHNELLSRGGKYAEMWHKQAEKYVKEDEVV